MVPSVLFDVLFDATYLVDKYECSIFNVSGMSLNFTSAAIAIDNVKWCTRCADGRRREGTMIHCIVHVAAGSD